MFDKLRNSFVPESVVPKNSTLTTLDLRDTDIIKKELETKISEQKLAAFLNQPKPQIVITAASNYGEGDMIANLKVAAKARIEAPLTHHVLETSDGIKSVPVLPNPDIKNMGDFLKNSVPSSLEEISTSENPPLEHKAIEPELEVQIATKIEGTLKNKIEAGTPVEKILFTKEIFSMQKLVALRKKFADTTTENVISLIIAERQAQSAEIQASLDLKNLQEKISAYRENIERSKDNMNGLNLEMQRDIENEDTQAIDDISEKIRLENRSLKNSQIEITSLKEKINKLSKDAVQDISSRNTAIEGKRMALAEKGINPEKVLQALAGIETIKSETETKVEVLSPELKALVEKAVPVQEQSPVDEEEASSESKPMAVEKKSWIRNMFSVGRKKISGLLSGIKDLMLNNKTNNRQKTEDRLKFAAVGAAMATVAGVGTLALHESLKDAPAIPKAPIEKNRELESKEEKKDDLRPEIKLPDEGVAVFPENKKEVEVSINTESKLSSLEIEINKVIDKDPKIRAEKNDGPIRLIKKVLNELNDNKITFLSSKLTQSVRDKMRENNIVYNETNFNAELDSVLQKIVSDGEMFKKYEATKYIDDNGKLGYRYDVKEGEYISKKDIIDMLLVEYKIKS